ncbi:MAG: DUF4831 family protein [Alistipes sp.]|nr:DUF4831 family protein [Alistipes sp.]
MKRILLLALMLVASAQMVQLSAQQLVKKRVGSYIESGNVVVAEAATTLAVDLVVESESVEVGIYARYAQKYFGQRAPLVNKSECRILAAEVAILEEGDYRAKPVEEKVATRSTTPIVPINRLSISEMQPEEAAREAAQQVYDLRQARLDLVTGELGDGAYGAGLQAALDELDRLEQAYLELFYGKRCRKVEVVRCVVPVETDKKSYIVARFNAEQGVLASDDLAGEIVMLNIQPTDMAYPASNEKGKIEYRYANNAHVTLSLAQSPLCTTTLPIFEFGETVKFLAPAK